MVARRILRKVSGAARRAKWLFPKARTSNHAQVGSTGTYPIDMYIDTPVADERVVANVLRVSGWAFSRTGTIARVAVLFDGTELDQLEYGTSRLDVMEVHRLPSEECGFSGLVTLPKSAATGEHVLQVAVTDDIGNTRTDGRTILVTEVGQTALGMLFWLDAPVEGTATAGVLDVSGWAFNTISPITSIVVHVDGVVVKQLTHGLIREDVYEIHPLPFARVSGFCGQIDLSSAEPGKHSLTVHFTMHSGATTVVSRTIFLRPNTVAYLEVERADWRGDALVVGGFALMPGNRLPWKIAAYTEGNLLGVCRVQLSRPDVRIRFPKVANAGQSGFELVCTLPAPLLTHPSRTLSLSIQCVDSDQRIAKQEIVVTHRPDEFSQAFTACRTDLEDLVWQVRLRARIEPSILNLATHYPLADRLKACDVFALPGKRESLLSADATAMADIVVFDGAAAEANPQARLARYATAILQPVQANTLPAEEGLRRAAVVTHWNPHAGLSAIPSVSVIIPAYNQVSYTRQCVERVLKTARPYISLEVIVVDDCSTDETPAVISQLARADARVRHVRNETNRGFVHTCNHGAEVATGDILIFLNNDTLPEPRWIEALLYTLVTQPQAGAVGGKLMYPDGTLQEAGGVIFNNGEGANFGRNSVRPDHPLFQTLREVDYCTGALLATPRALFLELGKFDERYSPGYYEETDYCFRIREAGLRVYYQPESVVIHFEGVTNGRDTKQGLKSYQVINRQKFVERWQDALSRQGPPPESYDLRAWNKLAVRHERELDPEAGIYTPKRALLVLASAPEYNHEGGSRQHSMLINFLQDAGWQVTVLQGYKSGEDKYVRQLQQRGVQIYCGYRCVGAGDSYVEDFAQLACEGRFQLAVIAPWALAEECIAALRTLSPETRIVADTMDLHFLRNIRRTLLGTDEEGRGNIVIPPFLGTELIRELTAYANADLVTTVSDDETTLLRAFIGTRVKVETLPLAETFASSPFSVAERRGLLFVGNFRHTPNAEAVEYLLSAIVPLMDPALLRAHPITIIGTALPDSLRIKAQGLDGVQMLGWVPSIEPHLHRARVNLVPLLHGAGTKVKLIQALMAGTPSVTTMIGAEGLSLKDGLHALIADTPEQFATCVASLATDDALWKTLALASRSHVLAEHSAELVRKRFGALINGIIVPQRAPAPQAREAASSAQLALTTGSESSLAL